MRNIVTFISRERKRERDRERKRERERERRERERDNIVHICKHNIQIAKIKLKMHLRINIRKTVNRNKECIQRIVNNSSAEKQVEGLI